MAAFSNEKGVQELLPKYVDLLLPSVEVAKTKTSEDVKVALEQVAKMGAFVATPLEQPKKVIRR
jgi:hypothetical protein